MPLMVSISSLKGGVGKTSVTLGLASAALAADMRVLVIDMDPHGDASTGLAVEDGGTDVGTMLSRPKKFTLSEEIVPSGWNALAEKAVMERQLQNEAEDFAEDDEEPDTEDPAEDAVDTAEGSAIDADSRAEEDGESNYDELDEGYEYVTEDTSAVEVEYEDETANPDLETDSVEEHQELTNPAGSRCGSVDVVRGSAATTGLESLTLKKALPRLRQLLDGEVEDYDLVLIDCPPTLGRLTSMAWAASDRVISIAEPSLFSVAGTERTLRAIARFEQNSEYSVGAASVVINKVRDNNPEHNYRIEEMTTLFGELVAVPSLPEFESFQRIQGSAYPVHFWPEPAAQDFAQKLTDLLEGLLN